MKDKQAEREAFFDLYKKGRKEATKECNDYYQNELNEVYKNYAKRLKPLEEENKQAKEIIYELLQIGVFQFPFQDNETNCLNIQITARAKAFLKE